LITDSERLERDWQGIVGDWLARIAFPIAAANGVLLVGCLDTSELMAAKQMVANDTAGICERADIIAGVRINRIDVVPSTQPRSRILSDTLIPNELQRMAIEAGEGAFLVEAGPGSGKTRVITERMARLIKSGVPPDRILMVTFTVAAARQMAARVAKITGGMRPAWINNFHKVCTKLLKEDLGVKHLNVFPPPAIKNLVRALLGHERIHRLYADPDSQSFFDGLFKEIDYHRWEKTQALMRGSGGLDLIGEPKSVVERIAVAYEKHLGERNILDFDLILYKVIWAMLENQDFARTVRGKWDYVQVDEAHDTDRVQMCFIEILRPRNIMWIADPNQTIYGFRGTDPYFTRAFVDGFDATLLPLSVNYRSKHEIVEAAERIMERGVDLGELQRLGEAKMRSARGSGGEVTLCAFDTTHQESAAIARTIDELIGRGEDPGEIAVLYRLRTASLMIERELARLGIPFDSANGAFWEQQYNKCLAAMMHVFARSDDRDAYAQALRYLGKRLVKSVFEEDPNAHPEDLILSHPRCRGAASFLRRTNSYRQMLDDSLHTVFGNWLEDSGFLAKFTKGMTPENRAEREAAVVEVLKAIEDAGSVVATINDVSFWGKPVGGRCVTLSTIHSAKGLEWKWVFLMGLTRAHLVDELDPEERRVFYVGITRAKDNLVLSYPNQFFVDWHRPRQPADGPVKYLAELDGLVRKLR